MNHRKRVNTSLSHYLPDRLPVDFLATPEIWEKLLKYFKIEPVHLTDEVFIDPAWEEVLSRLEVDCRVLSYDQFCNPPGEVLDRGSKIEWWDVKGRSTPGRMWRLEDKEGLRYDIFGRCFREEKNPTGSYEVNLNVLDRAESLNDIRNHPWPKPEWFDFSGLSEVVNSINNNNEYHIRFRAGSIFEIAWQLRGMDKFMMDLALDPAIPNYIMEIITDVTVQNIETVLASAGDKIDMVYFYDDIASTNSLLLSKEMWRQFIKPKHVRLIEMIKKYDKQVMYHTDGTVYDVLPELIDMGVDVLNPIQPDAKGMEPERLKSDFGDALSFHGGIDIIETLPMGTVNDVINEIMHRKKVLGKKGGYVLASSHHVQSDTPLENVLAMYDLNLRSMDVNY